MIESTAQKLQTAGGAEREARELRKLILVVAREAVELAIIRSDLTWDDAADITGKQIAIDAGLAIFGEATCDDQPTESVQKLMSFAARCANEARLEALEQAAQIAEDEWKLDESNHGHPEFRAKYGTVEVADAIRALKAAHAVAMTESTPQQLRDAEPEG